MDLSRETSQGLRRPLEQWKVRAWQRHRRLRLAGTASPAWVPLRLLSLVILARTL
jgi:hypothetical protein